MKITRSPNIPDVILFEPEVYRDERGCFQEVYREKKYSENIPSRFVQDNHSFSKKGILRGLHYQIGKTQGKLITVLAGEIFDVAVDIRRNSPTFGKYATAVLSSDNHFQLYIPEGFAHGFQIISESASVLYKCTDYFDPDCERGIRWNDPSLEIAWPLADPILSRKDQGLPFLTDIGEEDLP
ncbi:MAG: dTDP-4-dehydrorhamnose 3,5-epimerase [Candidatus Latescibacterota bacterium]